MEANKSGVLLHSKKKGEKEYLRLMKSPRALYSCMSESEKDRCQRNLVKLLAIKSKIKQENISIKQQFQLLIAVL